MPVMGVLTAGDEVAIEFIALSANAGITLMNTGYVPRPAVPPAPVVPAVVPVAPGKSGLQQTTVTAAFSLVIDVDVPAVGGGDLSVRVNGTLRDHATITGDVNWSYVIV